MYVVSTVEVKDFADGWIKTMVTVSKAHMNRERGRWLHEGYAVRVTQMYVEDLPEHPTIVWYGPAPRYDEGEQSLDVRD